MTKRIDRHSRREFLRFLAASPVLIGLREALGQSLPELYAPERIGRAADAINVFDFHEVAKQVLPPPHYAYMAMGTDDGGTLRANREGFGQFRLRVRRLVDVSKIDTSIELFGRRYPVPILIAPCGTHKAFHADGEPATARAASSRNVEMILSSVASTGIEDVNAAYGKPIWFQLYTSSDWRANVDRVKRAERAGCPVLVLTVDLPDSNREAVARFRRDTNPDCQACHGPDSDVIPPLPMVQSGDINTSHLDWDFVDRLKAATSMKLVIKGIVTREDAALAVGHGADGIIVSNHGGRAEDSGRSTIESLPEVVDAVDGRIPVICDSGFRRGTDIFKALALGADAIAIGRPYLWGLSAFGQEGVETVIDILTRELEIVMRQAGTTAIDAIGRQHLG
jgi:isopentenyl diphosphate isomerase/L-lactate dehydrogenase-like FMN-dependent dehydrogenase